MDVLFKLVKIGIGAILLYLLPGCSANMYTPCSPSLPLFDSASKAQMELTLGNYGFDIKGSFRVKGPFNISFGLNQLSGQSSVELAMGYSRTFSSIHFGLLAGYGSGATDFHEGDGGSSYDLFGNGSYRKYFLQPYFAAGNNNDLFGITARLCSMPYAITYINYHYLQPPLQEDVYYSGSEFETWIFYRHFYDKGLMLSIYFGSNSFNSSMPLDIQNLDGGISAGFGIGYRFK